MKALVVGYGSIGRRHIDNLTRFFDADVLVCTKQKYDDFLLKRGCKIVKSLDESIKEKPDIAIISNVTSAHVKTALELARSNVDLFIEKPLANSLFGVTDLMNISKKRKLVTFMGCNMRFHPAIKTIRDIIAKKEIGRIISVRAENGSYLPSWHPYEDYRKRYAARNDLGGGVVLTNIHEIDYLYWFFGNVSEILSITGKFSDLDLASEDLSSSLLRFKSKIIAELHLDYFQRPAFRSFKAIGTKGTIYWDSDSNTVKVYYSKKKKWIEKLKLKNYNINDSYVKEMSYFLRCVKRREETFNTIYDGAETLKIALAVKKASNSRKVIRLK